MHIFKQKHFWPFFFLKWLNLMEQLCLSAVICCNVYHNFHASHYWWVPSTTSLRKYWNVPLNRRVNDQHLKATVLLAQTTTCSVPAMQIPFFCSRGKLLLSLSRGSGLLSLVSRTELRSAPLSTLVLSCLQAVNTNVWVLTSWVCLCLFLSFSFFFTHPSRLHQTAPLQVSSPSW